MQEVNLAITDSWRDLVMRVSADDVLYQQLESFAQREPMPIDGLVAIAMSSQLAVWSTRDYLTEKSRWVSWDAFEKVLVKVPNGELDERYLL